LPAFLSSPAKVNLFLNVTGQRADGFHDLQSVFLRLPGLADTLIVSPPPEPLPGQGFTDVAPIQLHCPQHPALVTTDNTVVGAYHQFYAAYPHLPRHPLHITLNKQIPTQAGLGGGSSNAATLLTYLAHRHQIPITDPPLIEVAATVGSDVPFFLSGYKVARVTGRGEHVAPVSIHPHNAVCTQPWLIIQPDEPMSTPAAYQQMRVRNQYLWADMTALVHALAQPGDTVQAYMLNDFELVNPPSAAMALVWQTLLMLGCSRPLLCGSGSAVAGLMPADLTADHAHSLLSHALPAHWFRHWVPPRPVDVAG
jgi:4-diphosphocytidyl-2-C-methyl-D-erythritol kinase